MKSINKTKLRSFRELPEPFLIENRDPNQIDAIALPFKLFQQLFTESKDFAKEDKATCTLIIKNLSIGMTLLNKSESLHKAVFVESKNKVCFVLIAPKWRSTIEELTKEKDNE